MASRSDHVANLTCRNYSPICRVHDDTSITIAQGFSWCYVLFWWNGDQRPNLQYMSCVNSLQGLEFKVNCAPWWQRTLTFLPPCSRLPPRLRTASNVAIFCQASTNWLSASWKRNVVAPASRAEVKVCWLVVSTHTSFLEAEVLTLCCCLAPESTVLIPPTLAENFDFKPFLKVWCFPV